MRTAWKIFFVLILVSSYSCMVNRPYRPQQQQQRYGGYANIQLFYDELSPYGDWVHNREYGYVWIPHAGRNFYPYATNGRWVMTEYGWTWISDYQWGWAAFHYGRWDFDPNYGWFWFPDTEWGPAWVVWRQGNGYYGWAPMRPGMDIGMSFSSGYSDYDRWIFVRERDFGRGSLNRYYMNRRRNDELIRNTRVINNTVTDRRRNSVYVAGPDPSMVQNSTGRRISTYTVRDNDRPGTRIRNREIQVYRPLVANSPEGNRPAPPVIKDVKDIRPMRERNRNYQPGQAQPGQYDQEPGLGSRPVENADQTESRRKREMRDQYQEKQNAMQKRQEQLDTEQKDRSRDGDTQMRRVQKAQKQQQAERRQQTDQQKRIMRKERETRRQEEEDSIRVKRIERQTTTGTRRR